MEKPNCYNCIYRRKLIGDAHSKCEHPAAVREVAKHFNEPLYEAMAILASVGRVQPDGVMETGLNIKGHPHGIKNGWFLWPFNFDPVWLENCDGFTEKESEPQ